MILNPPLGLLGGTFDPIHYGHLRTALEVQQAADLREVRLIPCFQPVHRDPPLASPEQRVNMLKKAILNESRLQLELCEIDKGMASYTFDTLSLLRTKYPNTPLCFIMGLDAFLGFPTWHRFQEILDIAHLIIVHRPNYTLPKNGIVADFLKECLTQSSKNLHTQLNGSIFLQAVTLLEISATEIRKQIALQKNPRFLLPDAVYEYILSENIYSVANNEVTQ